MISPGCLILSALSESPHAVSLACPALLENVCNFRRMNPVEQHHNQEHERCVEKVEVRLMAK